MTGSRSSVVKGEMNGSSSWREMWGHGKNLQNWSCCVMKEMSYAVEILTVQDSKATTGKRSCKPEEGIHRGWTPS